jgi:hypothetical protein
MQKFLLAHINCIMNDRDQWQREAERLSDLLAQAPRSTHEDNLFKPHWLLFWWRRYK